MDYPYMTTEAKLILLPILENYYNENLVRAEFENCLWIENGQFYSRKMECRLGEIFRKYEFNTPEHYLLQFIWLDNKGTRTFKDGNNKSMSELVIEKLSSEGKTLLRTQVLKNIRAGIKLEQVLGSHLALCGKLAIAEAKKDILSIIANAEDEYHFKSDAVDIYLTLGGRLSDLISLYTTCTEYNSYFFFYLTRALSKTHPEMVIKIVKASFPSPERKVELCQLLAELGDEESFKELVNMVRVTRKAPHHIGMGHRITLLDTGRVLKELEDIMYLVVDRTYNNPRQFHDSACSIILEWLFALSAKSEGDLLTVIAFMEKIRDQFIGVYEEATDMNWHINRALENFRSSEEPVKSIAQIQQILCSI
jgi:hypothetical protein